MNAAIDGKRKASGSVPLGNELRVKKIKQIDKVTGLEEQVQKLEPENMTREL